MCAGLLIVSIIPADVLTAVLYNDKRLRTNILQQAKVTTRTTTTYNNKDVPEFLHNIADEVVADSEQFTIWESYSMHKSYETQGFGFCELIRDGVRSEALYTQSGIVIISE